MPSDCARRYSGALVSPPNIYPPWSRKTTSRARETSPNRTLNDVIIWPQFRSKAEQRYPLEISPGALWISIGKSNFVLQ